MVSQVVVQIKHKIIKDWLPEFDWQLIGGFDVF